MRRHQIYGLVAPTGRQNGRFLEVRLVTRAGAGPSDQNVIWVGQAGLVKESEE